MFPWLWSTTTLPTETPRPTCLGLLPPFSSPGAVAERSVWLISSWKFTLDFLKPVVLAFAMLSPTTSRSVW